MELVTPDVFLVARPQVSGQEVLRYLQAVGGEAWFERVFSPGSIGASKPLTDDAEALVEFCGRLCYRSWDVGLNPNVTKVRTDSAAYLRNILAVGHGSVLEHANFTFVLHNVSRVLTHELVRHRAGWAYSQESLRFVRLDELKMWLPDFMQPEADPVLWSEAARLLRHMEDFQRFMAAHFGIDDTKPCSRCRVSPADEPLKGCPGCNGTGGVPAMPFKQKKVITSAMRRFAPDGLATGIVATGNVRSWRHVIEMRTDPGAEEEIRLVAGQVARTLAVEVPLLFGDYVEGEDGSFTTKHRKV